MASMMGSLSDVRAQSDDGEQQVGQAGETHERDLTTVHAAHDVATARDSGIENDEKGAAFVRQAREATARYQDLSAAIAAGYRRMGPDMPSMGQHWIHPSMAAQGSLDPARPAVLTYLRSGSGLMLSGVAYTVPVRAGEAPPNPPVHADWHYHWGALEDEAFGHRHDEMGHPHEHGTRLAMIHAWIWVDNPDGLFAADNWALPFIRLGLPAPPRSESQAANALFLLSGGVDYFARMVQAVSGRNPTGSDEISDDDEDGGTDHVRVIDPDIVYAILEAQRTRVEQILNDAAGGEPDIAALADVWRGFCQAVWPDTHRRPANACR